MARLIPVTTDTDQTAVTNASAQFTKTLAANQTWLFWSNTDCYILQGANPTAAATDASMFVPSRVPVEIDGANGAKLAVIRATADGLASLTRCQVK